MPIHIERIRKTEAAQLHRRWEGTVPFVERLKMNISLFDPRLGCALQTERYVCGDLSEIADVFGKTGGAFLAEGWRMI
jgi:hypothetical protein